MQGRFYSPARGTGRRRRYTLALTFGVLLGLLAAWPALAQQQDPRPEVVGGEPVSNNRYRFLATVGDARLGGSARAQHFCGGTLIDRNSVLTAAHCMEGKPTSQLRVTVGRTSLSSGRGQTRRVIVKAIHPNYRGSASTGYDAAVLRLNKPVTGIEPIRLAKGNQNGLERPGRAATVAGWGSTIRQPPEGGGPTNKSDRMREVQVPIVSDERADGVYRTYAPNLMVAAGRQGKDTCLGDSGGPMFVTTSNRRTQIGVTSFGTGCGARGFPGVYAEVNAPSIRGFITRAAN